MKPWGIRLEPIVGAVRRRLYRTRDRLDDAADETSLRGWLALFATAAAIALMLVAVLRLLLLATMGGVGGRWFGAAVAGVLALTLLVIVTRNVVLSLIEPSNRRSLLLAFLTSTAAVSVGVEAFAAVTAAMVGGDVALWRLERFYLWQLVDSIPILDITGRLEWHEAPVMTGLGGRLLVLGFKLVVIPPLVRVAVGLYTVIDDRLVQLRSSAREQVAGQVRPDLYHWRRVVHFVPLLLAAGGGAVWGAVGPQAGVPTRVVSWIGLGVVFGVVAAAFVAIYYVVQVVARLPSIVALLAAVGLVWFDSIPQHVVLPHVAGLGLWGKVGSTVGIWLVLRVVLLLVWEWPELPEAVLATGLVLAFVGSDAPVRGWLNTHLTWTPGGVPVNHAVAAAGAWLTAALLGALLVRVVRRAPALESRDLTQAEGLRRDLRGYTYAAVHIGIVAAAALAFLRGIGVVQVQQATPVTRWTSASEAFAATAWHLADSLPGPDIPQILDWRLTTDFSGRWAGLIMIITIVLLVVLVAYPMLQSVTLWARLTVVESERFQPLVDAPATMVSHLRAVLAFLDTHETKDRPARYLDPRKILERRHRATRTAIKDAERQLARAARSQRRIVDLFGPSSHTYEAATNAVNETGNALGDYLEMTRWRRSAFESETPYPQRITNAHDALDAFTVTVERWKAAVR